MISTTFPHELRIEWRVAFLIYRKSRVHCVSPCSLAATHSALSSLHFPLPSPPGPGKWLARKPGSSGEGVSVPPRGGTGRVVQTMEGPSLSPSVQMAFSFWSPSPCAPHTALLPVAPPEQWAACEHFLLPRRTHPPSCSLALTPLCLAAHDSPSSPRGTRNGRWQPGV